MCLFIHLDLILANLLPEDCNITTGIAINIALKFLPKQFTVLPQAPQMGLEMLACRCLGSPPAIPESWLHHSESNLFAFQYLSYYLLRMKIVADPMIFFVTFFFSPVYLINLSDITLHTQFIYCELFVLYTDSCLCASVNV